jgi:circadian clock protein KaiC
LFGLEFLVRGAQEFDEPGVLLAFEESADDLTANVASLGFDLAALEADGRLVIDAVRIDASEIVTTGDFDLDGLFIRLASAVQSVGARRVVLTRSRCCSAHWATRRSCGTSSPGCCGG